MVENHYIIYFTGLPAWINAVIGWAWVIGTIGNLIFLIYVLKTFLR